MFQLFVQQQILHLAASKEELGNASQKLKELDVHHFIVSYMRVRIGLLDHGHFTEDVGFLDLMFVHHDFCIFQNKLHRVIYHHPLETLVLEAQAAPSPCIDSKNLSQRDLIHREQQSDISLIQLLITENLPLHLV